MRKRKQINDCLHCKLQRTCRDAQGAVVWKNCGGFQPEPDALTALKERLLQAAKNETQ